MLFILEVHLAITPQFIRLSIPSSCANKLPQISHQAAPPTKLLLFLFLLVLVFLLSNLLLSTIIVSLFLWYQ